MKNIILRVLFFVLVFGLTVQVPAQQNSDIYYEDGFSFQVVNDKGVRILRYSGNASTLDIPEQIKGLPVTSIGRETFQDRVNLTSINIPFSVTSFEEVAFMGCRNLASITVDNFNPVYTSVDGVLFDKTMQTIIRYPVGKNADTYTIPSSVRSIGREAFMKCNSLKSITIPSSVTSIKHMAFFDCSSLTSITVPSSVTSIGDYILARCNSLTSITVDSLNPAYASVDGVLFDKGIRTLIIYPASKNAGVYIIPSSVTSIEIEAFSGCNSLTRVIIPSSMTFIGESSFSYCNSLTNITIPSSVTAIENHAFIGCRNLTDINIPSSVTSIGFAAFYNCRSLTKITIPSSVTSIEDHAFNNCTGLTNVTLSRQTQVGEDVFPRSARISYSD